MVLPRSVPWLDWDEWLHVKNCFFSPDGVHGIAQGNHNLLTTHTTYGLEVVSMWRIRGRLPHSVESTAQLLEIIFLHKTSGRMEMELRLQYSLVVVRAVNGLVDPSQQGVFAESVFSIAQTIGLPGWIVELRHDATHNQLPSLSVLESAARRLIHWYYENYWQMQSQHLETLSALCPPRQLQSTAPAGSADTAADPLLFSDANSSSTILSEIFLPLFLETNIVQAAGCSKETSSAASTLREQAKSRNKSLSSTSIKKVFNKQCSQWWPRIAEIALANEAFIEILLCRLFAFAVVCYEKLPLYHLEVAETSSSRLRICMCELWIDALCSSKIGRKSRTSSAGKKASHIVASASHGCWQALFHRVRSVLARAGGGNSGIPSDFAELGNIQKRLTEFYSRSKTGHVGGIEGGELDAESEADGEREQDQEDREAPMSDDDSAGDDDLACKDDCVQVDDSKQHSVEDFENLLSDDSGSAGPKRGRAREEWTLCKKMPHWPLGLVSGKVDCRLYSIVDAAAPL